MRQNRSCFDLSLKFLSNSSCTFGERPYRPDELQLSAEAETQVLAKALSEYTEFFVAVFDIHFLALSEMIKESSSNRY